MSFFARGNIAGQCFEIEKPSLEELADEIVDLEIKYNEAAKQAMGVFGNYRYATAHISVAKKIPYGFWSHCIYNYTNEFGEYLENARTKRS